MLAGAHGARARQELPLWPTPRSRRTRGGRVPILGLEILRYAYNSHNPGGKTQVPRDDAAPQGAEAPTPLGDC